MALAIALVAGLMTLAGCGGSDSSSDTAASADAAPSTAAAADAAPATASSNGACKPDEVKMVIATRSLANPFDVEFIDGAKIVAEAAGLPLSTIVYNADSQLLISQVRQKLATGGKCMVLALEPNADADAAPLIQAVKEAGAYATTVWGKDDALHPWDFGENYVGHISFNGKPESEELGKYLLKAIGGHGNVIAINGLPGVPANQRKAGFEAAIKADSASKLLAQQSGDWDRKTAYKVTQDLLTKYGDQVQGIFAADDIMGLGVIQAVKAQGLSDKVTVVSHNGIRDGLLAVKNGEFDADYMNDARWMGAIAMAMPYCAATGAITPSKLDHGQRELYGPGELVTKDNVESFLTVDKAKYAALAKCDESLFEGTTPITYPLY